MRMIDKNGVRVAITIYDMSQVGGGIVWFNRIVEELDGEVNRNDIAKAIDGLEESGVIGYRYGRTKPGCAGTRIYIKREVEQAVRGLHLKFWNQLNEDKRLSCPSCGSIIADLQPIEPYDGNGVGFDFHCSDCGSSGEILLDKEEYVNGGNQHE